MSDREVIDRISRNCVPVALNLYEVRQDKGPAGEFYQTVAKQKPGQYQGLYMTTFEGKVLASRAAQPEKGSWTADTVKMLGEGMEAFGDVTPRKARFVDPKPFRGVGLRDDNSIALAAYTRPMVLGLDKRGLGAIAIDSVVLSEYERTSLVPPEMKKGTTWEMSPKMVRAFHRILSPTSDANNLARRDEVSKAVLSGKVERLAGGIAYLSYTGRLEGEHTWEFDPHKGKKIRAGVSLRGAGTADVKTGKLLTITLVGDGRYRHHPPYDEESKYGAVVEWRLRRE